MRKNVTARTVIIVAAILLCVYGIIGFPTSGAALMDNIRKNIRLGLDLKGGSHLRLQVQVHEAVQADAYTTSERLKEDLKKQNITWAAMDVNEVTNVNDADKVALTIKGIPAT
jgi:preprotein translocase subunit SecD